MMGLPYPTQAYQRLRFVPAPVQINSNILNKMFSSLKCSGTRAPVPNSSKDETKKKKMKWTQEYRMFLLKKRKRNNNVIILLIIYLLRQCLSVRRISLFSSNFFELGEHSLYYFISYFVLYFFMMCCVSV